MTFVKQLLVVAASGALAAAADAAHQIQQGYTVSDDWGHIGVLALTGALISVAHLVSGNTAAAGTTAGGSSTSKPMERT